MYFAVVRLFSGEGEGADVVLSEWLSQEIKVNNLFAGLFFYTNFWISYKFMI